jgi:hypothetical protein
LGIFTQIGEPVPHPRVTLFDRDDELDGLLSASTPDAAPSMIAVRVSNGASVKVNDDIRVVSGGDGVASAWVSGPRGYCLGHVVETQSSAIAEACQLLGHGLAGTVIREPTSDGIVYVGLRK